MNSERETICKIAEMKVNQRMTCEAFKSVPNR